MFEWTPDFHVNLMRMIDYHDQCIECYSSIFQNNHNKINCIKEDKIILIIKIETIKLITSLSDNSNFLFDIKNTTLNIHENNSFNAIIKNVFTIYTGEYGNIIYLI